MKTINWLITATLFLGLFFTSCNKDQDDNLTNEQVTEQMIVSSEDQATAEDFYQDVEDQVDEAIESRGGGGDCPTVTADPDWDTFPRTVTIDFGDSCEGPNGRVRKGQIVVTVTDNLINEGAVRTATFVDFFIDDAQIEGTRTLTNLGYDDNGNITLSRVVSGGQITFPNGEGASWESDVIMTQIAGGNTPLFFLDNVFEITGTASGVNRQGKAYTINILEPLIKKKACPWFVEGVISITSENVEVTLNYGNGECDRKAILTLPNGTEHEILMKKWW